MTSQAKKLFISIGVLVLITASLMVWDHWVWETRKTEDSVNVQKILGGLGMGAISSPVWNFINYDPRVSPVDDSLTWPIPGGYSYGPDRTATITYFEEVPKNEWNFLTKE
ncbi:MAG: hypothetical protein C0407_09445 [Desulfobacca sp.]|nr:hypothetical protein [Desulfobacca sp.]